jgi:hypothetical protein
VGINLDTVFTYVQDPHQLRKLVTFLESIIKKTLPNKNGVRSEKPGCYRYSDPNESDFDANFEEYLANVVLKCNIHHHTGTCFKNCKKKNSKDVQVGLWESLSGEKQH